MYKIFSNQHYFNNCFLIYFSFQEQMQEEMRKPLIIKKPTSFEKLYEESFIKIQRIKQKNDFLQKHVGVQVEQEIKKEVIKQKQFLEKEIREIKDIMNEIATRFKDPESKNKLKYIKVEAQKQIERNKFIMQDLVTKSFLHKSIEQAGNEDISHYMADGKAHFVQIGNHNRAISNENIINQKQKKDLQLRSQSQHQIQQDLEFQRKAIEQKNMLINEIQQSTMKIYDIMNDMAAMVNDQGQNLELITDNLVIAKQNIQGANQELQKAQKYQKKSNKKYLIFIGMIILLVVVVIGIIFIIKQF